MIKVSVIVPCYNVDKYVEECLNSIVNQTIKDIQIICVNDGSTDKTLTVLQKFQKKDNRIEIIDKENTGYGHSVNMGMSHAVGEYIGIVESDDFVEKNMFEKLYKTAKTYNLDVARCCYYEYHTNNKENIKKDFAFVPKNVVFCPLEDNNAPFWQQPTVWINIYNRKMLIDNNIRFLETPGASYQDISFSFKVYCATKRFMMIDDALLHYRVDNCSSSINSNGKTCCVCDEWDEIRAFLKGHDYIYNKIRHLAPIIQLGNYRWNFNRIRNNPKRGEFIKRWSSHLREHIKNGNIIWKKLKRRERINLMLIAFFPFVYKFKKSKMRG